MEVGIRAELGAAAMRMLVQPLASPTRGPPTDWEELVQTYDDWAIFQALLDELPEIDIHSL